MALCATAQELRTERISGQEPTDIRHCETSQGIESSGSADSLIEVRNIEIRTYVDTLRTITMRTDTIRQTEEINPNDRRGNYVELHAGAGIGSVTGLGSKNHNFLSRDLYWGNASATNKAGVSGVAQLQYVCFFHPSVGIGIGAWLANYTSYGTLAGDFVFPMSPKIVDSSGEPYIHHATINSWTERQTLHTIGVPISLQFQAWGKKRGAAGFFFDLGAAPVYTLVDCQYLSNYHILNGEIEHWGAYPNWSSGDNMLELHEVREFHKIAYNGQKGSLSVKRFTATAFFDLGLLIRLSRRTDMLIGIYGHYTFLDIQNAPPAEIGWKTEDFKNLEMSEYKGMLASKWQEDKTVTANETSMTSKTLVNNTGMLNLHPVEAGVKLGLHWHSAFKPKKKLTYEQHLDTALQLVERHDSIINARVITLTRAQQVQQHVDKLNRIYFTFDSYTLSDEAKQFLAAIADQLRTIPNKIIIGGHASKEGTRRHNEQLALNRALAVRRYLISLGIDAKRMMAKEYGSSVQNAINTNNDMSLDRRVEIIVIDNANQELVTY